MSRMEMSSLVVLLALTTVGCGFAEVAPPQAPTKEVPVVPDQRSSPPEPGTTRVIIDANGDQATVTEVVDVTSSIGSAYVNGQSATVYGTSVTTKPICVAPCFADLKPGLHVLRFSSSTNDRASAAAVQVGDNSKVVRHAMGRTEMWSMGHFAAEMLTILGATAVMTGATVFATGKAIGHDDGGRSDDLSNSGLTIGAAGAGAMVIGIPLMILLRPVHQSGSTTEIPLVANAIP